MTNVFVHYWRPDGRELTNVEMLFSRVPTQGESIYVNDVRYEVVRVDHHPGKNADPRKEHERTGSKFPQDAEIWLNRAAVDHNPIRSKGHDASKADVKGDLPKFSEVRALLKKAVEKLEGKERGIAEGAMIDLARLLDLGLETSDVSVDSPEVYKRLAHLSAEIATIRNKYQD